MVKPLIYVFPDVPHVYEEFLKESEAEGRVKKCGTDLDAVCYQSSEINDGYNDVSFKKAIVCDKPISLNSGSHRILIHGTYKGHRYVMSVEERESFGCNPKGDIINIGAYSEEGRKLLENEKKTLPLDLLSSFIFISTGYSPIYPEYVTELIPAGRLSKIIRLDRFTIRITNPYSIEGRGCKLTDEASRCFLIF